MIPYTVVPPGAKVDLTPIRLSDRTFKMDVDKGRIMPVQIDGLEALKQRIFCILSTELGAHVMLPGFGVQKNDVLGSDREYAYVMLTYRIKEALLRDDCITDVDGFELVPELSEGDVLYIRCRVQSVFGDIETGGAMRV